MKVFDRGRARRRARRLPAQGRSASRDLPEPPADDPGRARRLHRLRGLRRRLPGQDKTEVSHKAINMEPVADHRDVERGDLGLLRADPTSSTGAASPHDTVKGVAAARAAVRVLRGLRAAAARRRTSSCSPSCSATGWSSPTPPAARRSTAATCRRRRGPRTPTGRGPAWSNSPVRGQRRVRPRDAPRPRRSRPTRLGGCSRGCAPDRRRISSRRIARRRPARPRPAIDAQRARGRPSCGRRWQRSTIRPRDARLC